MTRILEMFSPLGREREKDKPEDFQSEQLPSSRRVERNLIKQRLREERRVSRDVDFVTESECVCAVSAKIRDK